MAARLPECLQQISALRAAHARSVSPGRGPAHALLPPSPLRAVLEGEAWAPALTGSRLRAAAAAVCLPLSNPQPLAGQSLERTRGPSVSAQPAPAAISTIGSRSRTRDLVACAAGRGRKEGPRHVFDRGDRGESFLAEWMSSSITPRHLLAVRKTSRGIQTNPRPLPGDVRVRSDVR
jgi:hypothetical protein